MNPWIVPPDIEVIVGKPGCRWEPEEHARVKQWMLSVARHHLGDGPAVQAAWDNFLGKHQGIIETYFDSSLPQDQGLSLLRGFQWFCIARKPGKDWTDSEKEAIFNQLTHEMLDGLVRFACGFTRRGLKDGERAFELARDVVAAKLRDAFRSLHTYDPTRYRRWREKCPFRNWLFVMVARAASRKAQQEARHQAWTQRIAAIQQLPPLPCHHEPGIDWEEIEPLLDGLSPKYREALDLCDKQGMSRKEAARESCWPCSEGPMKVRLCRAHQEVRRLKRIHCYIDQLPSELRQAIILCDLKGLPLAEAVKKTRILEKEMEAYLFQARLELRRLMEEGGEAL